MQFFNKNKLNTGLNGEFLDDDEEKGINGTVVDAKLLNGLGHEIENIIKAGGMTPSENENDQLLRAIKNLGGSGVSSSAENVSYNNSISGLQQKNYDFPKIKTPIDNLTYIYLTESSVMGKIEKEEDNYFLKGNVSAVSSQNILPISLTIDGKDGYEILSFIGQFFNIDYETRNIENVNWVDALEDEIIVNGINDGWQFVFVQNMIAIKRKDNGEIPENTYSVTLNIKNRVLLKPDENIIAWQYGISENILLKIVNESGTAKIKSITKIYPYLRDTEWIFFTNNILENYIDLDTEHTSGIISSSGKKVIWTLKKNYQDLPYSIIIKYEDESQIQKNDFFTINITPDKNADISFTKGDAVNVQNAIDSLSELKQDKLTAGTNITIQGNTISTSSNVATQTDLSAKQDKLTAGENIVIEKQGENTVIKSLGGGDAEDIGFDNSKAQQQQLVGYDYPKYKKSIPSTVSIVLSNGNNNYNASIVKQSDGSYRLKCNISNFNISGGYFSLSIKNVNNLSNIYQRLSFLSQFFNIQTIYTTIDSLNYINLEASECVISSLNFSLKFALIYSDYNKSLDLIIKIDSSSIQSGSYNITLNIKNRVLRQEDRNIFAFSDPFMGTQNIMDNYIFSLSQNNSSVKLTGSYTLKKDAGLVIGFYSPIIENYFNVSSSIEWKNTTGITSSSKKPLKFSLYKNNSAGNEKPLYLLFLMYQDETDLKAGEKITFDLTPDKNSTLGPIYKDVTNVQQLGEVLSQKDTELLNKINGLKAANIKIDTISGLNASNVQQAIAALNQKIYNIYDTSRKVPINDYALINNEKYNFYRVFCVKEVELIEDSKEHMLAVKYDTVNRANIVRHSITLVGGQKTICFSGSCSAANGFDLRTNIYSGELQLYYTIYSAQSFYKIIFFIDYY